MLRRARISVKPNVRPSTGRAGAGILEAGSRDRGGQKAEGAEVAGEAPEVTPAAPETQAATSRTPPCRTVETDSEHRLPEEAAAAAPATATPAAVAPTKLIASPAAPVSSSTSTTASSVAHIAEAGASTAADNSGLVASTAAAVAPDVLVSLGADNLVASADDNAAADVVATPAASVDTDADVTSAAPLTSVTPHSSPSIVAVPPTLAATCAAVSSADLADSAASNPAAHSPPSAHTVTAPPVVISLLTETISAITPTTTAAASSTAACSAARSQQHATAGDEPMRPGPDSNLLSPSADAFEEATTLSIAATAASARHHRSARAPATAAAAATPSRPDAGKLLPQSRRKRLSAAPIIPRTRAAAHAPVPAGPAKKPQTSPPAEDGTASKLTAAATVEGPRDPWGSPTSEASGEVSPAVPVKPPTGETQYSSVGPSGADAAEAVDHAQEVYERPPIVPDWRVTDGETPGPVTLAQLGVSAEEPASGAVKCAAATGADAETPPVAQSAEVSGAPGSAAALPGRLVEPSRSEISKKLLASLKKSLLKPPALSVKATPAGANDDDDYDDDSGTAVVTAQDGSARPGTASGGGGGGGGGGSGTNAGRTQPRPNFKKSSRTVQKTAREMAEKTEAKKAARKLAWRTWEQHQSAPDRSQMTMKDLLYWVPRNNPMLRLKSEDGKLLPEKRFDKYPKGDRSAAHGDGGGSLEPTPPDGPTSPLPPLPPPDCSDYPAPSPSPVAAPAAGVPAPPSDAAAASAAAASNASVPSTPCAPASSDSPADVSSAAAAAPSLSPAGDAQSLLVPQVRVAEDGSIVLNEDSLMVEVSRTEGLPPVSDCDPIHEYGSHTTYSSFRKSYHAKQWGLLETELFFLAISMVGMDFSMIGQLFPNRSRVDIKNKFKREERCNPRKIDQAFRNKLPLDVSCFETLLQEFERQKTEALNRAPDSKGRRRRKYHPKKTGRRRSDADSDDGDADCWSESGGESGPGAAATETRARTAAQSVTGRAIGAAAATQNGIGTEIRTVTRTATETQTGTETPTGTATPGTGGCTSVPGPPPLPPAPSGLEEAELLLSLGCEIARGAGAGTGTDAGAPAPEPSLELVVESAERRDERSGGDEDIDDEEDFERVKERMLSHPTRSGRRPKPTAFYSTGSVGPGGDKPIKEGGGAAKRPRRREAQDPAAPVRPKPRPSTCARKPPLPPMRPPRRDATDKATVLATRGRGGLVTLRAVLPPEEEEEEGRGGGDRASERRHRASGLLAAAATPAPPVRPEHMSCAPAFVPVCLRSPEPQPLTEHMEEQVELSEGDAMLEELVVTCVEEMVVADDDDCPEEEEAESVDPGSDTCALHVEQNCGVVIADDEHLRVNEAFVYEMMEQAGFGSMQDAYVSSQEGDGGGSAPTMLCFMMCEGGETGAAFRLAGGDGGDAAGAAPDVEHLSLAAVADDQEGQETSTETNNAKSAALEGSGVPPGDWEGAAPTISDGHMTSWAAPVGAPSPEWPLAAAAAALDTAGNSAERHAAEAAPGSPETPDVLPREAPSGASGDLLTPESGRDTVKEEGGSVAEPAEPTVPTVPVSVLTEAGVAVDDGGQADPVQLPATASAGDAGAVPRPRRPRSDVADGPPAKRHAADTTLGTPEAPDVPSREAASDNLLTPESGRGTGEDEAPVAEAAEPAVSPALPGSTEAPAADDDGRSDSARPRPTRSAGDAKKGGADVTPPARRARLAKPRPNLAACSARRPSGPAGTAKPAQVGPLGAVK